MFCNSRAKGVLEIYFIGQKRGTWTHTHKHTQLNLYRALGTFGVLLTLKLINEWKLFVRKWFFPKGYTGDLSSLMLMMLFLSLNWYMKWGIKKQVERERKKYMYGPEMLQVILWSKTSFKRLKYKIWCIWLFGILFWVSNSVVSRFSAFPIHLWNLGWELPFELLNVNDNNNSICGDIKSSKLNSKIKTKNVHILQCTRTHFGGCDGGWTENEKIKMKLFKEFKFN